MLKYLYPVLICLLSFSLCSCHHGVRKKYLEYPPEFDETGYESSSLMSPEDVEKRLKELEATPYPPYTIQGGDAFRINVYNEPELNDTSNQIVVTPDGYLVVALLGPIYVKDLSILEATDAITKAYGEFLKYPKVSLIPLSIHGKQATVLGAAASPGLYNVSENTRVSDVIAGAGGYQVGLLDGKTVEMADIPNSYIVRNGEILPVNFSKAVYGGDALHNIRVFPEDLIFIARKDSSRVLVMGEVKSPRQLNWTAGMTIVDVIAQVGGLTDEHWKTLLLLRRTKGADPGSELKVYKVDIDDLLSGRGRNFKVASEDIVYVPKDALSEYNVFIRKLLPTSQLISAITGPYFLFTN